MGKKKPASLNTRPVARASSLAEFLKAPAIGSKSALEAAV
jgi:hypothetical protein